MFDCSIRENIAYGYGDGSQSVPDDLIIKAARCANIHNFITGLPCVSITSICKLDVFKSIKACYWKQGLHQIKLKEQQ